MKMDRSLALSAVTGMVPGCRPWYLASGENAAATEQHPEAMGILAFVRTRAFLAGTGGRPSRSMEERERSAVR
jgi:hypothetical protein